MGLGFLLAAAAASGALLWIAASVSRIADAKEKQAEAIKDISESLDLTLFDSDPDAPCDFTRLVRAAEKLAGITLPPDPKVGDAPGTME